MKQNYTRLDSALLCASNNFKVFPCKPAEKSPLIKGWEEQATTDHQQISDWWTQWPNANIGVMTGLASGFFVVDLDVKGNGPKNMAELESHNGKLPPTVKVITGGGGQHLFFRMPEGTTIGNSTGIIPGVDIRGEGGLIIAPPSLHNSGRSYEWAIGCAPGEVEIAECPPWLLELVTAPRSRRRDSMDSPDQPIIEGSRNSTLASLAGTMRRRGMTQEAIEHALIAENNKRCNPPLSEDEVLEIAQSISRYPQAPKEYPLTELGNAERLRDRFGEDLRYCQPWGKWLVFDGKRWAENGIREVHKRYVLTVRHMLDEAASIEDETKRAALRKWQRASESGKAFREMVNHAKHFKELAVLPNQLDNYKMLLNLENGTFDLEKGVLMPPQREHFITKLAPVKYDPEAKCPNWTAFLEKITGGNTTLIEFLQRVAGYTLTGNTNEQCMFILYGDGSNGKSTFTNTLAALLGEDYVKNTPTQTLMARKNEGIPNDLAALQGARMVIASEGEQGQALAESRIKTMTGGDAISARFLHGEFFSYKPEFKIFFFSNHKPDIKGIDEGIWRRIRLIPFVVKISDEEKDPQLPEKLRAELPGIFNWALEGCRNWQMSGLGYPDVVRAATESYRSEMNVVARFIEDSCERAKGYRVSLQSLYDRYKDWCKDNGEKECSKNQFSQNLSKLDFKSRRSGPNGCNEIHGLRSIEQPNVVDEVNALNAEADKKPGLEAHPKLKLAQPGLGQEKDLSPDSELFDTF